MRVLGIDPGYAIVGYGTVEYVNNKFYPVEFGAVTTQAHTPFESRLQEVYDGIDQVIKRAKPEAIAIEQLFFTTNQKTVIQVAMARGVILLCAKNNNVPVFEYTPLQIKQSVAGYGKAVKKQVQEMTRILLKLPAIPKPDDTADALAMAICHGNCFNNRMFGQYGR
jgi:crossover junction endodeoxyribonuclease RuvC